MKGFPVTENSSSPNHEPALKLDTSVPHGARVWNYWLGGKDNFAADREAGEQVRQVFPEIVEVARVSRAFLVRAVRYLAGEAGIRQFLDIGTGLPTADNTHEVAQAVAPESRIVYVDNDQALSIVRRLMEGLPSGSYLASYDGTNTSPAVVRAAEIWNQSANPTYHLRSPEQFAARFEGMEPVEPGVVSVTRWRPDPSLPELPAEVDQYCGVGRKP